jgi:hypothetical protein
MVCSSVQQFAKSLLIATFPRAPHSHDDASPNISGPSLGLLHKFRKNTVNDYRGGQVFTIVAIIEFE